MYSYIACKTFLVVVLCQRVQPQDTTSADPGSSLTTIAESTAATTVQAFMTLTPTSADEDSTPTSLVVATTDSTGAIESSTLFSTGLTAPVMNEITVTDAGSGSISNTASGDTTEISATAFVTLDADVGSGTTDQPTAPSTTDIGSGVETTTVQEGSGFTTVDSSDGSTSGSGDTDIITTASSETTVTSFSESGDFISTESSNATSVLEVSTGFTSFGDTTVAVSDAAAGFPWYLIVIICLAVVVVLLIIIIIVVYCKTRGQPAGSALLKKATPVDAADIAVAETIPKTFQPAPGLNQARPKPVPAPTIFPSEPMEEESRMNFVSSTPMKAPLYILDPSSSVRKRDKAVARSRPGQSSFDDDEGFNEPLMTRDEKKPRKKGKRRKPHNQNVQDVTTESEVDPSERSINYQPYFLPTPIQTALTGKALGDQLTDDAMAERQYLQRSDIERHQNKQRLRMQRRGQLNDSFKNNQRTIDAVLQPLPPKALQGIEERKRLQKHGLLDASDSKPRRSSRRKPSRHDSEASNSSVETTATEEKHAAHEKVIAKMTKLLEEAYALFSPAIQKTSVQPLNSRAAGPDPSQTPSTINLQPPIDHRLFTRTNTPPVLHPQPGSFGYNNPSYLPGTIPQRSNDSQSPIWTPYRTFDRLQELQKQDSSLSTVPNVRPNAIQNIPMPNAPYQPSTSFIHPTHHGVHDPFAPTISSSIPGHAQPVHQQPNSYEMNPLENRPNSSTFTPITQSGNPATDQTENYIDTGVDEPAASIVQSIKDTLAELSGKRTSDNATQESNC